MRYVHKSSEILRENIKGVKCNPSCLSAPDARGKFGCGVLIAPSQKPSRNNELRWLWCLATLSMILQENLSRNAFPRFFVPIRRINVHSSLMPLKVAPGEHISECVAAKMELKCRHENDSSGFVHRPLQRCNLSPNRFHSKIHSNCESQFGQALNSYVLKTIINQLSFEEQMFSRLFLMACPAVWSRETIKLSRLLSGRRNLFNLSSDLFSKGKLADVPAHHSRCDVTGMAFSYFNVYSQIQFPRASQKSSPFRINNWIIYNIFDVSDGIFIFISPFLFMKSWAAKLHHSGAAENVVFQNVLWLEMYF